MRTRNRNGNDMIPKKINNYFLVVVNDEKWVWFSMRGIDRSQPQPHACCLYFFHLWKGRKMRSNFVWWDFEALFQMRGECLFLDFSCGFGLRQIWTINSAVESRKRPAWIPFIRTLGTVFMRIAVTIFPSQRKHLTIQGQPADTMYEQVISVFIYASDQHTELLAKHKMNVRNPTREINNHRSFSVAPVANTRKNHVLSMQLVRFTSALYTTCNGQERQMWFPCACKKRVGYKCFAQPMANSSESPNI